MWYSIGVSFVRIAFTGTRSLLSAKVTKRGIEEGYSTKRE
jgi:hypothetical protein